jgi:hypothetical protein
VGLKVTREEQEKMRQSIEKQQETKSTQNSVTVMFHDRTAFLGVIDSFRALKQMARSLSASLTDCFVLPAAPSLSRPLNGALRADFARHQTRRRTSPHIEKFFAEMPTACSAWLVFRANPNTRGRSAAVFTITPMTEQRRCKAA